MWLLLAFLLALLAIGLPYWQIPYNQFDFGHTEVLPGALLLGLFTAALIGFGRSSLRWTAAAMLMVVPLVDAVSIYKDTALDATTHSLAPLELAIALFLGAWFVVPGLLIGWAIQAWRKGST